MSDVVVVFQAVEELDRARRAIVEAGVAVRCIEPPASVADVAVPYLVLPDAARAALHAAIRSGVMIVGRLPYREPSADALAEVDSAPPPAEDIVGRVVIVFAAPCVASVADIRLTAQVQGDMAPVMPYLNAESPTATYSPAGPTLTFMDGPRLVNLFPHRVAIARARDLHDAWRTLALVKRRVNDVWARRQAITPRHERRVRVSALEVYSRLPKTNCRACGEATCLAFAAKLLAGEQRLANCRPVFGGEHEGLKAALLEIAAGLGL